MSLPAFVEMSLHSHNAPSEAAAIQSGVASVAGRAAEGSPPLPLDGLTWEQQLGGLLALYAGTTKTWELAQRFVRGGHFIVLNYRKAGDQDGLLRPFAMADSTASIIPADELQETIANVISADRQRHPEWFA